MNQDQAKDQLIGELRAEIEYLKDVRARNAEVLADLLSENERLELEVERLKMAPA